WVAGTSGGHWESGRWMSGPAVGRYDASGRWLEGQAAGHRDANGRWVADAEPGYYDTNGRWRAGQAIGYYDTQGRWIATATSASGYGTQASYTTNGGYGERRDIASREAWLDQRIRRAMDDRSMDRNEARRALRNLNDIRRQEAGMPHRNGQLRSRDEAYIQARLDDLSNRVRQDRQD
ncbi:MAG TPA: hypothetical protein VGC92_07400, partial [Phenylobacterium sp.]